MTDTDERQETAAPPRGPAGRISWRRRLLYLLLAAIGVTVAVHAFGGAHVGITGLSLAGLAVAILVILRLPHLRKHFHNPYKKGGGSGSLNYPGQRGLGLRRPVRGKGSGPGLPRLMRPHRSGSSPASPRRHRSGAGLLSRSRRTGGAGQARSGRRGAGILRGRRSAGTAPRARRGRSPGSGRGGAGSALAGRRAARRTSAGRSRSGRAGSRPFARTGGRRPGGPAAGARRQPSRWNPWARRRAAAAAARRRGAGGGARPGGPGPGRPSRRLPSRWRPVARWRARRRAGSGSGQGRQGQGRQGQGRQGQGRQGQGRQGQGRQGQGRQGQGRTRPRSIRHPFGGRRFWRTARWPGWRHIGWQLKYGRFMPHRLHRRGWHIIFGTPGNPRLVRRGWHKAFGTPQQRAGRRAARKAHQARIRAARRRRTLHLYGRRTHGRAFWRRQTRRTPRTHAATGQGLNRRQRLARWWHIRRNRLHRGLGIRGTRTRGKRPPRPLLGPVRGNPAMQRFRRSGPGGWIARLDRRRQDRWMRRQRRNAPALPVRRPSAPVPHVPGYGAPRVMYTGNGNHRARGGRNVDTHAMADEIRSMGGAEFADPQDVHDTLSGMHELVQSMQDVLNGWGLSLAETGAHPAYAEAVQEAAGNMAGIADQLQGVTAGGVMRGPGG